MIRAAVLFAVSACTSDLLLGSRACDPLTATCPCASTAECPEPFECMPVANNAPTGTCAVPAHCTIIDGDLSCAQPETCENANACTTQGLSCCASDRACYPPACLGCCP